MRKTIAVYVENKYGVLARISGLFMRRGFNIDSLTVGETEDPDYSRVTVTMDADDNILNQVVNQLNKLYNVRKVKVLAPGTSTERELLLLKMGNTADKRSDIMAACEIYNAKIIDYSRSNISIEVTGDSDKIQSFVELMKPNGIIEMCRTGVVALERGDNTLAEK